MIVYTGPKTHAEFRAEIISKLPPELFTPWWKFWKPRISPAMDQMINIMDEHLLIQKEAMESFMVNGFYERVTDERPTDT